MVNRHDDSFIIPVEALKDCFGRFFLIEDDRPYRDRIHFCAFLELAYWFYIDSWVDNDKRLKNVSFACFIQQVVDKIGVSIPGGGSVQSLVTEFVNFKHRVGTYGAILVDTTLSKVLLVQSFSGQSWGFPKGKIEENEDPADCAIREVKEEINYDISPHLNPQLYLEMKIMEQTARLFIIFGVPETTKFKTNTRKEIGEIRWFELNKLPAHRGDKRPLMDTNFTPNNFFVILPFVKRLREEVRTMEKRCLETFGVPVYKQDEFRPTFLQRYYPAVYKQLVHNEELARLEREMAKASKDSDDPSEKTIKEQLEEEKQRKFQANLSHFLTEMKNSSLLEQELKRQLPLEQNTNCDSGGDSEPKKFRFKTPLKTQQEDRPTAWTEPEVPSHNNAAPTTQPPDTTFAPAGGVLRSVFPVVPLCRSKTWDNAQLDFDDIMNTVEDVWRANSMSHCSENTAAGAKRKHRSKENRYH